MNSALNKFLQLATEAGLLTTIASVDLDSQFNNYEDSRDMAERCKFVPEQASEDQLQDPNMVEERGLKKKVRGLLKECLTTTWALIGPRP